MVNLPLTEQSSRSIRAELTTRVRKGTWAKGGMIPSRRALAKEFNVSVPTVHKAISDMIAEGILRVDANRTFVFGDPDSLVGNPAAVSGDTVRRVSSAPTTTKITIIAAIRPGADRMVGDARQVLMVEEAENALAELGIQPTFINRYSVEQRVHDPSAGGYAMDNASVAPTLADAVIAEVSSAVITFDADVLSENYDFVSRLARHGIQVVVAGAVEKPVAGCVTVTHDNVNDGFQAGSHLIQCGCRRLLFFAPYEAYWVSARLEGMRQAVRRHSGDAVTISEHVGKGDVAALRRASKYTLIHSEIGYESASRLLASGVDVDGVVAANDDVAAGYLRAANERGLKVGRDYLMVGFDDTSQSRDLGLSSMHPPVAMMGREAALAANRLVTKQNIYTSIAIKSRLVARASSKFDAG